MSANDLPELPLTVDTLEKYLAYYQTVNHPFGVSLCQQAIAAIDLKKRCEELEVELRDRTTSLKFIAVHGGKHIDGIDCSGSWASLTARSSLPQQDWESVNAIIRMNELEKVGDEMEKALMAAVIMLWNDHPEDVESTFSLNQLEDFADNTKQFSSSKVEELFKLALSHWRKVKEGK